MKSWNRRTAGPILMRFASRRSSSPARCWGSPASNRYCCSDARSVLEQRIPGAVENLHPHRNALAHALGDDAIILEQPGAAFEPRRRSGGAVESDGHIQRVDAQPPPVVAREPP